MMFAWWEKIQKMQKIQRLSVYFGMLMAVGFLILILGILAAIKITPYATYKNTNYGFQVKFPAYWKVVRKPAGGAIIAFVSPKENSLDAFNENVNISYQDLPPDRKMTIRLFSELAVEQLTRTFQNQIEVLESHPATVAGQPGYRFSYAGVAGDNIKNPIQYLHAWTLVGNRAYIITYTGVKSEFKKYSIKINKIIDSFELLSPEQMKSPQPSQSPPQQ